MREFPKKKIPEKTEIPREIKEKPGKDKDAGEYWRDHQWRDKIFFLKFFEEEKPMSFEDLLEKSGVGKESGSRKIRRIGEIRRAIDESKKNGIVIEIKKNVFQINPNSPNFTTFKKFLEREIKKYEDS